MGLGCRQEVWSERQGAAGTVTPRTTKAGKPGSTGRPDLPHSPSNSPEQPCPLTRGDLPWPRKLSPAYCTCVGLFTVGGREEDPSPLFRVVLIHFTTNLISPCQSTHTRLTPGDGAAEWLIAHLVLSTAVTQCSTYSAHQFSGYRTLQNSGDSVILQLA